MVLQTPERPQHFMTEIKRERGGKLSLEVKRRMGEAGGQSREDGVREIGHVWKEALMLREIQV